MYKNIEFLNSVNILFRLSLVLGIHFLIRPEEHSGKISREKIVAHN